MARNAEFHQLVERLLDHDEPLKEGEMQEYRKKLGERISRSQRRLKIAALALLMGIPAMFFGYRALEAGLPGWVHFLGMILSLAVIVVPITILWSLLIGLPSYFRARRDCHDSMLALLVRKVDDLSSRVDTIAPKK